MGTYSNVQCTETDTVTEIVCSDSNLNVLNHSDNNSVRIDDVRRVNWSLLFNKYLVISVSRSVTEKSHLTQFCMSLTHDSMNSLQSFCILCSLSTPSIRLPARRAIFSLYSRALRLGLRENQVRNHENVTCRDFTLQVCDSLLGQRRECRAHHCERRPLCAQFHQR